LTPLEGNLARVREAIVSACRRAGRSPEEVELMAVSKTYPAEVIAEAAALGLTLFVENRVQEFAAKAPLVREGPSVRVHLIGHLQSNKVSKVVGVCDLIESVSSKTLVEAIGKRALSMGIRQNVLIEVNVGKEPQKSGVLPEHLGELLEFASQTRGIYVLGLMAIPPFSANSERNCYYFDTMFQLFVDMSAKKYDNVSVQLLSMGMSDSYIDAIRAGSNMVRIGSALFGER